MKKIGVLIILVLVLTAMLGCEQSSVQRQAHKNDAYIALNNELAGNFTLALGGYSETLGWASGFQRSASLDNFTMPEIKVLDALEKALPYAEMAPLEPTADAAVTALAAPLRSFCEILTEVGDYYNNREYLNDNFAQGEVLHSKLVNAYPALSVRIEAFVEATGDMLGRM